jgi:hypothetical protein
MTKVFINFSSLLTLDTLGTFNSRAGRSKIPVTAVKKFLKNHGRHLNNGGLLSILQKTKDDSGGSILC